MSAHTNNPADSLREYSVKELEIIAERYHKQMENGFSIPVDIDLIIETMPGVDLDIYPSLKANYDILGMTGTDDRGMILIYIDEGLADQASQQRRYRMTLAEEFAHILIHRDALMQVKNPKDFIAIHSHPQWNIFDRNAKRLAAALLMPARTVARSAGEWYSKIIDVLPPATKYTNPDMIKKNITSQLADQYDVSLASMRFRLGEWPIQVLDKIDTAMREGMDFLS